MQEGKKYSNLETAMNDLRRSGLHCIIVNTEQEAKNFIMYHIGTGTHVRLDSSDEVKSLRLGKSVEEKGGFLVNHGFDNFIKRSSGKNIIDMVDVNGRDFVNSDMSKIICERIGKQDKNYKKKTIVVLNMKNNESNAAIVKLHSDLEMIKKNHKNQNCYPGDISVIIIINE